LILFKKSIEILIIEIIVPKGRYHEVDIDQTIPNKNTQA